MGSVEWNAQHVNISLGSGRWRHEADRMQFGLCECKLSHCSHAWLIAALWTVAHQAVLSMWFSRQEYWSRLWRLPPWDLHHQGSNQHLLCLLRWQGSSLLLVSPGKPQCMFCLWANFPQVVWCLALRNERKRLLLDVLYQINIRFLQK